MFGRRYGRGYPRTNQRSSYMLMWLLMGLAQQVAQLPVKPPVTLALMAANILVHISPPVLFNSIDLSQVRNICLQPNSIIYSIAHGRLDFLPRLLLSAFVHGDDMHLYYNMASLLWKGVNLETSLGSLAFAQLCAFVLVASHSLVVFSAWSLAQLGYGSQMNTCAVGFSAVLFALKVVWNNKGPSHTSVQGLPVPSKYAAWLELVLIQLLVPNASFMGHLCGIVAGLAYLMLEQWNIPTFFVRNYTSTPSYTYARGTTGRRSYPQPTTTPIETSSEIEEREVREAIRRSLEEQNAHARADINAQGQATRDHDRESTRARRLQRFGQL